MNTILIPSQTLFVIVMADEYQMHKKSIHNVVLVRIRGVQYVSRPAFPHWYSADTICFVLVTSSCTTESNSPRFRHLRLIKTCGDDTSSFGAIIRSSTNESYTSRRQASLDGHPPPKLMQRCYRMISCQTLNHVPLRAIE